MRSPTVDDARRVSAGLFPLVLVAVTAALAVGPSSVAVAAPTASGAAAGSGKARLTLGGGRAAKQLATAGVETRALRPAARRGKRVALPVRSVTVGRSATIALRGGIAFGAGRHVLRLRALRVKLSAARATVSARSGERRIAVFAAKLAKGKAKLDRAAVEARLARVAVALTPRGAKLLRTRLALRAVSAGRLGRLAIDAKPRPRSGPRPEAGPPGSGGGGGSGGVVPGGPVAGPIANEPPVLARPAGAVDLTGASLTWRPRDSWIRYINTGEGTSVFGGALDGPVEGSPPLVYSFHGFPFEGGWYHPQSGQAAVYFQGGVGFRYGDHGIDFSTASPEIEINGAASRAIFTFDGRDGTKYANQRGVLVNLHPASIQRPPGGEVHYVDVPATIPADTGASVFAGLYSANAEFGTISVSFSAP